MQPSPARSGHQVAEGVRDDVVAAVPAGVRSLLDVGCATGATGAELKRRGVEHVVGLELNPATAERARAVLDEVLVGDVEAGLADTLADGAFDCIVYADVLEHLVDPWSVVRSHLRLLAPGGVVIASIPNIAYWRVVRDLLRGRWEYTASGTLDVTHLRFFTPRSMRELLERAGLEVVRVHTSLPASGGRSLLLNRLTRARFEHLLVWRYVLEARRAREDSNLRPAD